MSDLVLTDITGGIATVTLNRPPQRNAASFELLEVLDDAVAAIEGDERVRVMILTGAGPVFCPGLDLQELLVDSEADREAVFRLVRKLSRVGRRINRLPIPTIACVQGAAIGGGMMLALVTDFTISHAEAKIGYPPAKLNLSPAALSPFLIRRIGPGRARAMLLKGGAMSGTEALERGLITHLVNPAAIESVAADLAGELAQAGRQATIDLKRLMLELDGSLDDEALDRAADCSARIIAGEEAQEPLKAKRRC
ncbi:MAG: enoyl-CoA hydratase/isomerase family protein [Phycisphaerales bacterium]|nr:MAG: enoyl-CoA hydratase/isomerase family protein [Phycisphaerales bacterium]